MMKRILHLRIICRWAYDSTPASTATRPSPSAAVSVLRDRLRRPGRTGPCPTRIQPLNWTDPPGHALPVRAPSPVREHPAGRRPGYDLGCADAPVVAFAPDRDA